MVNQYRSSTQRLASWFLDSRNKWKQRALNKQKELRKAGIKIRDLQKSREDWKTKTKECLAQVKQLEEEIELLKKKGNISRGKT